MKAVEYSDKDQFIRFGGSTAADMNFDVTKDGAFPFLIACAKGNLDFINLMLCNPGLDIEKVDKNGVNAFFMAAYHGHIPVMRRLMEKGIDMFHKNANGSNVLHIAVKREQMDVIHELIRIQYPLDEPKVNGITAFGIAAMRGSMEILELLFEKGADFNLTSPAGIGPLYLAIKARQVDATAFLIEAGANLYINDPVKIDYSPVLIAIKTAQLPIIEMMADSAGQELDNFRDS
jgi:ankyrin repeat protein